MRRRYTQLIFIAFFSLPFAANPMWSQQYGQWRLALDKNNVEVYIHRSTDMRVRSYKATTTVNMPLDSLEVILDDIDNYPTWQSHVKEAEMVYRRSDSTYHVRTTTDFPWPNKDRELMWAVHKEWDRRSATLVYDQICSTNTIPDRNRHGSILQAFVSWRLDPINDDQVKITMAMTVDKGGKIPNWMINMLSADAPYHTLSNLKQHQVKSEALSALD